MENLRHKSISCLKKKQKYISRSCYRRSLLRKHFKSFQYSVMHKLILNNYAKFTAITSQVTLHLIANVRFRSGNYKNAITSGWTLAVMYYNCSLTVITHDRNDSCFAWSLSSRSLDYETFRKFHIYYNFFAT